VAFTTLSGADGADKIEITIGDPANSDSATYSGLDVYFNGDNGTADGGTPVGDDDTLLSLNTVGKQGAVGGEGNDTFNFVNTTGVVGAPGEGIYARGDAGNDVFNISSDAANATVARINEADLAGGAGDDTFNIQGGAASTTIRGGAGEDVINLSGNYTNSIVKGGGDGDVFNTLGDLVLDNSKIRGQGGGDGGMLFTTSVTSDSSTINGNGGNDEIRFSAAFGNIAGLTVGGGTGDDLIELSGAALTDADADDIQFNGGLGIDSITSGAGDDKINGGGDADTILSGAGDDMIFGGLGADSVVAGAGNDTIQGGDGEGGADAADNIDGGDGNDSIIGDAGNDILTGGAGNDNITGDGGNDAITGDAGADTILGGEGNDNIAGGVGDDSLTGDAGADTINGGTGADSLMGGDGSDTIFTGDATSAGPTFATSGDDTVHGGADSDTIVLGSTTAEADVDCDGNTLVISAIGDSEASAGGFDVITGFRSRRINTAVFDDGDRLENLSIDISSVSDILAGSVATAIDVADLGNVEVTAASSFAEITTAFNTPGAPLMTASSNGTVNVYTFNARDRAGTVNETYLVINDTNNALTSGDLMFQFTQGSGAAISAGSVTSSTDLAQSIVNGVPALGGEANVIVI